MQFISEHRSREDMIIETLGSLAALGGAIFISVSMMQTRKLGKRVHFLIPVLYQAVTSAFICPFFMVWMLYFRTSVTTTYGWYEFGMLTLLSIFGFLAWIFQTKSY